MKCAACNGTLTEKEQRVNKRTGELETMCAECILISLGVNFADEYNVFSYRDNLSVDDVLGLVGDTGETQERKYGEV